MKRAIRLLFAAAVALGGCGLQPPCEPNGELTSSGCECKAGFRAQGWECVTLTEAADAGVPPVTCGRDEVASGDACVCAEGFYLREGACAPVPACDGPEDALEENDTPGRARPIILGEKYALRACPLDPDYFLLDLQAGEAVAIDLGFRGKQGDLDMFLWAPDGRDWSAAPVASSTGHGAGERIVFTAKTGGPHALAVIAKGEGQAEYTLSTSGQKAKEGPTVDESRGDCACLDTSIPGVRVPCQFELRFLAFTPTDAPFGDEKAEFAFDIDAGEGTRYFGFLDEKIGVGVTRSVNQLVRGASVACEAQSALGVSIRAREWDDYSGDEWAEATLNIPLACTPSSEVEYRTVPLEFKRNGKVKHKVDLKLGLFFKNPECGDDFADECPPVPPPEGYDPTPKPCEFDIVPRYFSHVDSPATDKSGEFAVRMSSGDLDEESDAFDLRVGSTHTLDMDVLEHVTVPCGQSTTRVINVVVTEGDAFGIDAGVEKKTITLACPAKQPSGEVYAFNVDVKNRAGRGDVRHKVTTDIVVKNNEPASCVPPPLPALKFPCEYGVYMTSFTHTDSPAGDKNGEFHFVATIDGESEDAYIDDIRRGDTVQPDDLLGRVVVPCGETRTVGLHLAAYEEDWDWTTGVTISNPDETASLDDTLTFTCPPPPTMAAHAHSLEFRNRGGKVKHRADLQVQPKLENTTLACECLGDQPPTCDRQIVFYSFQHDASSTGDNHGNFTLNFWANDDGLTAVDPPGAVSSLAGFYLTRSLEVDRGETLVQDAPLKTGDGDLLGTHYSAIVKVPLSAPMPVTFRVQGTEADSFGSDDAESSVDAMLSCDKEREDLPLRLEFRDKRGVKHIGNLVLRVEAP